MSTTIKKRHIISSPVFATFVFVFIEIMFFSALSSSYFVIKKGRGVWDIPGSIKMPVLPAAFNTMVLLLSALFLFLAVRALQNGKAMADIKGFLLRVIFLGLLFVCFQSFLGAQLINSGLKMTTSIFGACFYLIVGAHTLHVLFGAITLAFLYFNKKLDITSLKAFMVFWVFVVGIWPFLYAQLYF
ncbi:MAG: cytochrome c oxidase subunit 3 [Oligoflexia bacterium]|nr:cytochrome c oxidase subunit 3 [Oligoflexia bacterium]